MTVRVLPTRRNVKVGTPSYHSNTKEKLPLASGPPNETTRRSEWLIGLAPEASPHETDTEVQLLRSFVHQGRARYLQRHARRQRF